MEVLYAWAVTSPCCNKPYSCSPSIGLCEDLPLYYPEFIWPQKKVGSITDGAPPVPRIQLPCPVTAYHVTAYDVTRISLRKICRPLYVTFEYLHDCQNTVILKRIQKWICFIAARGFTKPVTKPYCRYNVSNGHVSNRATAQSIFLLERSCPFFPPLLWQRTVSKCVQNVDMWFILNKLKWHKTNL